MGGGGAGRVGGGKEEVGGDELGEMVGREVRGHGRGDSGGGGGGKLGAFVGRRKNHANQIFANIVKIKYACGWKRKK